MTRRITLLRHTDNDDDVLSAEGVTAAVELGAGLREAYHLAVSTGAQRATQTVACLLAGMGRAVPGGVVVEEGLRSRVEDQWREAYQEAGGGEMADFRRVAADLVDREARTLGAALRRVAGRLDEGQHALVVGHSPTNEAAVLGVTGVEIGSLGKGEGVVLAIDGDTITITSDVAS